MSDFGRLQELAREAGIPVAPPSITAIPAVMPLTAVVGDVLSCTMGEWSGEPTGYAYSWQHVGYPAEIGTGNSYTTVEDDAGKSVVCVVTATNDMGSIAAPPSNPVAVTAAESPPP